MSDFTNLPTKLEIPKTLFFYELTGEKKMNKW